jgi:hypothetical protein
MRGDLIERLEALARTVNPAPSMISDNDDSRVKLPPDDTRALLREAATALRALRDAPVGVIDSVARFATATVLEIGVDSALDATAAGQRVRLVVVGEEG